MPRRARVKGEFSIYHVIQRGNEKKNIFLSDEDRIRFLDTVERMKKKYNFQVYAYCLMDNHVHLLINDNGNDISKIIKSLNISYAYYFNRIYKRCGHLFQDRFKSELVDNDAYLLEVSKYIHNNPVKAGLVKNASGYKWSSYSFYTGKMTNMDKLIDTGRILGSFSNNVNKAAKGYGEFVNKYTDKSFDIMDVDEGALDDSANTNYLRSREQALERIKKAGEKEGIDYEQINKNIAFRNRLMKEIRMNSAFTLKEIGQLFGGISESRVSRILGR